MEGNDTRERSEEVKTWLWRYREAKKDVIRLDGELQELILSHENPRAIEYSDMPKGGCSQSDLSNYMVKLEKARKKLDKAKYKRIIIFQEIRNVIERLPNADERQVISCRYIQLNGIKKKSWEEICMITGHEWRQTHYIHSRALGNIANYLTILNRKEEE